MAGGACQAPYPVSLLLEPKLAGCPSPRLSQAAAVDTGLVPAMLLLTRTCWNSGVSILSYPQHIRPSLLLLSLLLLALFSLAHEQAPHPLLLLSLHLRHELLQLSLSHLLQALLYDRLLVHL